MTELLEQHALTAGCPLSYLEDRLPTRAFRAVRRYFEAQELVHPTVGHLADLYRRRRHYDIHRLGLAGIQRVAELLEAAGLSDEARASGAADAGDDGGQLVSSEVSRRLSAGAQPVSLAKVLHDYGQRWEIERVERSTEWIAVHRDTGGGYIRIVGASNLDGLQIKMDRVEHEEPEEREPGAKQGAGG